MGCSGTVCGDPISTGTTHYWHILSAMARVLLGSHFSHWWFTLVEWEKKHIPGGWAECMLQGGAFFPFVPSSGLSDVGLVSLLHRSIGNRIVLIFFFVKLNLLMDLVLFVYPFSCPWWSLFNPILGLACLSPLLSIICLCTRCYRYDAVLETALSGATDHYGCKFSCFRTRDLLLCFSHVSKAFSPFSMDQREPPVVVVALSSLWCIGLLFFYWRLINTRSTSRRFFRSSFLVFQLTSITFMVLLMTDYQLLLRHFVKWLFTVLTGGALVLFLLK